MKVVNAQEKLMQAEAIESNGFPFSVSFLSLELTVRSCLLFKYIDLIVCSASLENGAIPKMSKAKRAKSI